MKASEAHGVCQAWLALWRAYKSADSPVRKEALGLSVQPACSLATKSKACFTGAEAGAGQTCRDF